jgi:hypothetical protein
MLIYVYYHCTFLLFLVANCSGTLYVHKLYLLVIDFFLLLNWVVCSSTCILDKKCKIFMSISAQIYKTLQYTPPESTSPWL